MGCHMTNDMTFSREVHVSFGDCDPAGIVFYPNFYRWFDATFHGWLRAAGHPHEMLCAELGAAGIGLMDTGAGFRSPVRDGDRLRITARVEEWATRFVCVRYDAFVGDRLVVEGFEKRGLFIADGSRLKAGDVSVLRPVLEKKIESDTIS